MKKMLLITLIAALPVITFAQQKNTPAQQQDQLKKEMEELRKQMQGQVKALQDSLSRLSQQLSKMEAEKIKKFDRYFNEEYENLEIPEVPPIPGFGEEWNRALEELKEEDFHFECPTTPDFSEDWSRALEELGDHDFRFEMAPMPEMPPIPDLEFNYEMPESPGFYKYPQQWKFDLEIPRIDPPSWKRRGNRHEEFLEMLPFYEFFKS